MRSQHPDGQNVHFKKANHLFSGETMIGLMDKPVHKTYIVMMNLIFEPNLTEEV